MNILLLSKKDYNVISKKVVYIMIKFNPSNKSEKIVITIRIEDYRVEELDKIASKLNISRNELISQCLDFAVKNIEFKKK